jgi:thiol-disulfide isomerase/thioredoxin
LLVKDVAGQFGARVRVSIEEYGNSRLAEKFGVRRYPVVFVDEVLLARPKDFGFAGPDDVSGGRYIPWREPANQRRFKDDLRRAVSRRLAGERVTGSDIGDVASPDAALDGPAQLPALALRTVAGREFDVSSTEGRATIVEMWATWCPPCRSTLEWLDTLQREHASSLRVIAVAVDSVPADVTAMLETLKPSYAVVLGTPEIVRAFGEVAAVPKLLIFDRAGRLAKVLHGAPADLHARIEAAVKDASR